MSYLTDEERIIVLSSKLNPSAQDFEDIKSLISDKNKKIDLGRLIEVATFNGVAPFLYKNLMTLGDFPAEAMYGLRKAALYTFRKNAANLSRLMEILRLLKARGIEAIPLKGSLASEIIFGDIFLYIAGDIDILVRPSALKDVKKALTDNGFKYDEATERDMLSSHYHLVFYDEQHTVEVHWNLVKRYFAVSPEFWWEDTLSIRYGDDNVLSLSPERYLMYTIFRLFSHEFACLKYFVMVAGIINAYYEDIDWAELLRLSERHGMGKLVVFTLLLIKELFGIKLPDEIFNKRVILYELLKRAVITGLFNGQRRGSSLRKAFYVLLLDTPGAMLHILLGRTFPGKGELRLRYGIPENSKKIYFYYLLNPFLLPLMILKKKGPITPGGRCGGSGGVNCFKIKNKRIP